MRTTRCRDGQSDRGPFLRSRPGSRPRSRAQETSATRLRSLDAQWVAVLALLPDLWAAYQIE